MTGRQGASVPTRWWLFQWALLTLAIGGFSADGRDSHLTEYTSIVCDNEDLHLSCATDQSIFVTRALYGRSDSMTCTSQNTSDVTCPPPVPLVDAGGMCYGYSNCTLAFSNLSLPHGCENVTNYLNVTFVCIPGSSLQSLCNTPLQGIGNASIGFLSSPSTSSSGSCSVTLTPPVGQVVSLDLIYLDLNNYSNSSLLLLGNTSFSLQYFLTTSSTPTLTSLIFTNINISYIPDGAVFILQYNVLGCKEAAVPIPAHGHISYYSYGQQASFECASGFTLEGAGVVTCNGSSWHGDPGTCNPPVECGLLAAIPNGQVIHGGTTVGSTVNYSCIAGFQLSVEDVRTCQPDGTWDGQEPRCNKIVCGYPGVPEFGSAVPSVVISYPPGTVVTFSCQEGYALEGATTTTCGVDGTWDQPRPSCQAVTTAIPSTVGTTAEVTVSTTGQPAGLVPGVLVAAGLVLIVFAAVMIYIKCFKKRDLKSASTRRLPVDTESDWYEDGTSVDYSCTRPNGSINTKAEAITQNHATHVNEELQGKQNHSNHNNHVKNNNTLPPEMTANTSHAGVPNGSYVSPMTSAGPGNAMTGNGTAEQALSKNRSSGTETTYM